MGSIISGAAGAVVFQIQNIVNNEKAEAAKCHLWTDWRQFSARGQSDTRADSSGNARRPGALSSGRGHRIFEETRQPENAQSDYRNLPVTFAQK